MKEVADSSRADASPLAPGGEDELERGEIVSDRFVVESPIGSGGMGRIYLAYQRPFNRPVALKVMHRRTSKNRELVERFFQEASTVSHLAHPNTVTVYDFGRTSTGLLYIAMELVDGISLGEEIRRRRSIPADEAIPYTIQIAQSLGEAHHKGLIHRDLKPDNVMVCRPEGSDPFVKVLDFGIAKVVGKDVSWTKVGNIVGTPFYMAPEQAKGNEVDGRTDLYSLGCCLFEMLTGSPPYSDESPVKVLMSHQNDPIPTLPKGFHPALDDFVRRALAKDPRDRPADAAAFAAELLAAVIEMRSDNALDGQVATQTPMHERKSVDSPLTAFGPPRVVTPRSGPIASVQETWQDMEEAPRTPQRDSRRGTSSATSNDAIGRAQTVDASSGELQGTFPSGQSGPHAFNTGFHEASATGWKVFALTMVGLLLVGAAFLVGKEMSQPPEAAPVTADEPVEAVATTAEVAFDSQPQGSIVYVNDVAMGATPLTIERALDRPIDVRFVKSGFRPFEMDAVELSDTTQNRVFAPLEPKRFRVTTVSPLDRASLEVNGKSYGLVKEGVPRTIEVSFPTDELEIRLEAEGYEPFIERVDAELLTENYELAPSADQFVEVSPEPANVQNPK